MWERPILPSPLGIEAVRAGFRVQFANASALIERPAKADREKRLEEMIRELSRFQLIIIDEMGYLPFVQDRYLGEYVVEAFEKQDEIKKLWNNNFISAAGDIGDLSYMIPCIQIGYSGFSGTIHGDDFKDEDAQMIYEIFPRFVSQVLEYMSGKIDKSKLYKRSFEEYEECLNQIVYSKQDK